MEGDKKRLQNERTTLGGKLDDHKQKVVTIRQRISDLEGSIGASALLRKKVQ